MARAADARPVLEGKATEEPLTAEELTEIRQQLRFLREHRRVLHLRVNAQEDLLLNEVREPTRRGVCRHLLAKVDRAHVFSAAERLDPAAATRLAEGVLRISPGVDYLLLYLDCVRRSSSGRQAVAALANALEHIDFREVSPGQMRRVLDLLVELFDARQLPAMLLGLLEGKAFRDAFDSSAAELPQALAEIVVPLRAAQAVVLHDKPHRFGPEALSRGIELLLAGDEHALLRRPAAVRRRLLELAIAAGVATPAALPLLESVGDPALALALARAWIAAGNEADARRLLQTLSRKHADLREPRRWLEALDAPRLGRFARIGNRRTAVQLDTMQPVTLLFANGDEPWLEIAKTLILPGVAPVLAAGTTDDASWIAVARPGQRLAVALDRRRGLAPVGICSQAAELLAALAALGIRLPDARLGRFELDDSGRLWLADLGGAERADADERHGRLAAALCREVFAAAPRRVAPQGLLDRVDAAAASANAVARVLVARSFLGDSSL